MFDKNNIPKKTTHGLLRMMDINVSEDGFAAIEKSRRNLLKELMEDKICK